MPGIVWRGARRTGGHGGAARFRGLPRRLYLCTPTRLNTWLGCPRRYRMSYLDRPTPAKGAAWARSSLGASVHNALAGWWRLPVAQRTVAAAGVLLDRGWIAEGHADGAQSRRYRDWARAMAEGYVAGLNPADEPVGVERTVAARTDAIAVSGRIDRLDARPSPRAGAGEWNCITCRPGRYSPGSTPGNRWPGTFGAPRKSRPNVPRPMSGCARLRRAAPATCSRPRPRRHAAGAISCGTAARDARPLSAAGPGKGSRKSRSDGSHTERTVVAAGSPAPSVAFQKSVSASAVVAGASTAGEWAAAGMHDRVARSAAAMSS